MNARRNVEEIAGDGDGCHADAASIVEEVGWQAGKFTQRHRDSSHRSNPHNRRSSLTSPTKGPEPVPNPIVRVQRCGHFESRGRGRTHAQRAEKPHLFRRSVCTIPGMRHLRQMGECRSGFG
jgi:hypothetical protein